jgi:hypothetical protein
LVIENPSFKNAAISLARNPLGIIALFLFFIYSVACLTFRFSNNLPEYVIQYFVYFILIYPFIVLIVFYRLVTKHHTKLYAPQDFVNPEHFMYCIYGDQQRALTRQQTIEQTPQLPTRGNQ